MRWGCCAVGVARDLTSFARARLSFKSKRTGEKVEGDLGQYFHDRYGLTLQFPNMNTVSLL